MQYRSVIKLALAVVLFTSTLQCVNTLPLKQPQHEQSSSLAGEGDPSHSDTAKEGGGPRESSSGPAFKSEAASKITHEKDGEIVARETALGGVAGVAEHSIMGAAKSGGVLPHILAEVSTKTIRSAHKAQVPGGGTHGVGHGPTVHSEEEDPAMMETPNGEVTVIQDEHMPRYRLAAHKETSNFETFAPVVVGAVAGGATYAATSALIPPAAGLAAVAAGTMAAGAAGELVFHTTKDAGKNILAGKDPLQPQDAGELATVAASGAVGGLVATAAGPIAGGLVSGAAKAFAESGVQVTGGVHADQHVAAH